MQQTLRDRATDVARDLILENNDAPVSTEQLLALCYLRAWADAATVHAAVDRRATRRAYQPAEVARV
jgi:hypothetical protein